MSVDIKLNLIKPSKDLRLACKAYCNIDKVYTFANKNQLKEMVDLIFLINKDYSIISTNRLNYKNLIDNIVNKKKLSNIEKKHLIVLKKLFPIVINKKSEDFLNTFITNFKEKELKIIKPYLDVIYNSTKVSSTFFVANNTRPGFGGSATNLSFHISIGDDVDYRKFTKNRIYILLIHELIHVINSNNEIYNRIEKYILDKYGGIKKQSFSETFTSTIENILAYKLGYNKEKYARYRYNDKEDIILEDKIRKVYNSWEKLKGKNKDKFIVYLEKNIKKII